MQKQHENPRPPQQGQQGDPRPGERPDQDRGMPGQKPRDPNQPQHDEQGRRYGHGGDEGKVGQDTDGDGKVVKPGQKPGQSGGRGLPDNQ